MEKDLKGLLNILVPKKRKTCIDCDRQGSSKCGEVKYVVVSSSSGYYRKTPDERCVKGD